MGGASLTAAIVRDICGMAYPTAGAIHQRGIRGFLRCGFLAGGFARFHSGSRGRDRLVPFSCKAGFCVRRSTSTSQDLQRTRPRSLLPANTTYNEKAGPKGPALRSIRRRV
jgi:hypothetical protein